MVRTNCCMKTDKSKFAAWLLTALVFGYVGMGFAQTNTPRIQFAATEFDFGKLKAGDVIKHAFVFTNTGTATLEITDVRPSCGCTTAGSYDRQVAPGQTGSIPLQFNSTGFNGELGKVVTVICNDPAQSSLILRIKGTVWIPVEVTPATVVFKISSDSEVRETRSARIVSNL